jgi:F0F1-type ATP synthase alpha subunit
LDITKIIDFEKTLYEKLETKYKKLNESILSEKALSESIEEGIKKLIMETLEEFN